MAELSGLLSLAKDVGRRSLGALAGELETDRTLQRVMSGLIELAAARHALGDAPRRREGEPLELLLVGYNGKRNTGADVRVEEIVRQLRHLFGDDHVALTVLTLDPEKTRGYFAGAKQLRMPKVFPKFLFDAVHRHHGVIACEGSMFKSKFSDALTVLLGGALGLASAEGKLAVAYGGEAGAMSPPLEAFVERHCREALVVVRNPESADVLRSIGLPPPVVGTDTAWTFRAARPEVAEELLGQSGWDGKKPIVALGPIEPFVWPIRPDLVKSALHAAAGVFRTAHYDSIYFHTVGAETRARQDRYIQSIASAVSAFRLDHDVFPIVVGMEQLDRRACEELAGELGEVPCFVSDEHDMYTLVSILRRCSMVVSSRFHALVTSMSAGVPSAGITMDERIKNLLAQRGHAHLSLEVDDPELKDRLYDVLRSLHREHDAIADAVGRSVVRRVETLGGMGRGLVEHVRAAHPELEIRSGLGLGSDAWAHLPELAPELRALVEKYA
jgi:polysaccharide pyruvyl transferase WcaK-like protein